MSLSATVPVDASAAVSLRVPRGGSEDLEAGVASVLDGIDVVRDVSIERVTRVRPTWTDIRVDADVALTVAVPQTDDPVDACVTRLEDGFGITGVDAVVVDDA
ncbi:hypothetical protein ACFQL1_17475 [Halomicroarcula sp. GCM10025709]|uniref:hypothetical protein n=1 Tax=Haloarcula TaxID=2237 RepID=UPI0024C3C9AC|nr:hypothetical protein [Halomicroarcula sp. YJ-61-S]